MIVLDLSYDDSNLDPDTERMIRVAAGDRAAFDELVRRNFGSTVRIITKLMGSDSQSEDLAQDVFLRVYRSRERYVPSAKFSTFLGTVIRNTVLNAKRSLSRSRICSTEIGFLQSAGDGESGDVVVPSVEVDLAEQLDDQQTVAIVNQAISRLPRRQRMAIELVHVRGLTYMGAAQKMETSRKAVKSLLGRGRAALGDTLRDEYTRRFEPGS